MPVVVLTVDEMLAKGLELLGFNSLLRQQNVSRLQNVSRFKALFGSDPVVYAQLWEDLQTTEIPGARIDGRATGIDHYLMAVYFLWCYPTESHLAGLFNICEKSVRKWIWYFVGKIQALKQEKICWPAEWTQNMAANLVPSMPFTVDGTHCRFRDPGDTKFYSHKLGKAAVNYELALSIHEDALIWISGPHPAGKTDIVVFREGGLKDMIPAGMKGVADNGYRGEKFVLATANKLDEKEVKDFKRRARARHETFYGRLKNFQCLEVRFRHGIEKHKMAFEAVAVICQYQLENGFPLFAV